MGSRSKRNPFFDACQDYTIEDRSVADSCCSEQSNERALSDLTRSSHAATPLDQFRTSTLTAATELTGATNVAHNLTKMLETYEEEELSIDLNEVANNNSSQQNFGMADDDDDVSIDFNTDGRLSMNIEVSGAQCQISRLDMGWFHDDNDGDNLCRPTPLSRQSSVKSILFKGGDRLPRKQSDQRVSFGESARDQLMEEQGSKAINSANTDDVARRESNVSFATAIATLNGSDLDISDHSNPDGILRTPCPPTMGGASNTASHFNSTKANVVNSQSQHDSNPDIASDNVDDTAKQEPIQAQVHTPFNARSSLVCDRSSLNPTWFAQRGLMSQKSFKVYQKEMKKNVMRSMKAGSDGALDIDKTRKKRLSRRLTADQLDSSGHTNCTFATAISDHGCNSINTDDVARRESNISFGTAVANLNGSELDISDHSKPDGIQTPCPPNQESASNTALHFNSNKANVVNSQSQHDSDPNIASDNVDDTAKQEPIQTQVHTPFRSQSSLVCNRSSLAPSWFAQRGLMSQRSFKVYQKEMKKNVMRNLTEGSDGAPEFDKTRKKRLSRSLTVDQAQDIDKLRKKRLSRSLTADQLDSSGHTNCTFATAISDYGCDLPKPKPDRREQSGRVARSQSDPIRPVSIDSSGHTNNTFHTAKTQSSSGMNPADESILIDFDQLAKALNQSGEEDRNAAYAILLQFMMAKPTQKSAKMTPHEVSCLTNLISRLSSSVSDASDDDSLFRNDPYSEDKSSHTLEESKPTLQKDKAPVKTLSFSSAENRPPSTTVRAVTSPRDLDNGIRQMDGTSNSTLPKATPREKRGSTGAVSVLTDNSTESDASDDDSLFRNDPYSQDESSHTLEESKLTLQKDKAPVKTLSFSSAENRPPSTTVRAVTSPRDLDNGIRQMDGTSNSTLPKATPREKRGSTGAVSVLTDDSAEPFKEDSMVSASEPPDLDYESTASTPEIYVEDQVKVVSVTSINNKDSLATPRPLEKRPSLDNFNHASEKALCNDTSFANLNPNERPIEIKMFSKPKLSQSAHKTVNMRSNDVLTEGMNHLNMTMIVSLYGKLREMSLLGYASVKFVDIDVNSHQSLARKKEMKRLGLPCLDSDLYLDNTREAEFIVRAVLDEYEMFEMSLELAKSLKQNSLSHMVHDASLLKEFKTWVGESAMMNLANSEGLEVVWFSGRHPKDIHYCICVDRESATVTVVFNGQETIFGRIKNSAMMEHTNPVGHEDYEGNDEVFNLRAAVSEEILRPRRDTKMNIIDEIKEKVEKIGKEITGGRYHLSVTGHSLGAGYAAVAGFYLGSDARLKLASPVRVFTFASSRVGCRTFQQSFKHLEDTGRLQHARFTNTNDLVSLRPFWDMSGSWQYDDWYQHVGVHIRLSANETQAVEISYDQEKGFWQELYDMIKSYLCGSARKSRMSEYQHRMHSARESWVAQNNEAQKSGKRIKSIQSLDELYSSKEWLGRDYAETSGFSYTTYILISFFVSLEVALLFRFASHLMSNGV